MQPQFIVFVVVQFAWSGLAAGSLSLPVPPIAQWHGQFEENGFIILRQVFGENMLRPCREHLEHVIWSPDPSRRPRTKGVVTDAGKYLGAEDYDSMSRIFWLPAAPLKIRNRTYRLNGVEGFPSPNPWLALIRDPRIVQIAEALVGMRKPGFTGLLFERGSQQALHEDTWYGKGGRKPGGMIGVWFALDDVDDSNGPLLYVPGSHRDRPEMNFTPGTRGGFGRKNRMAIETREHRDLAYDTSKRWVPHAKPFYARAGDVGIWHERLLHGGAPIRDWSRSRLSIVIHFADRL